MITFKKDVEALGWLSAFVDGLLIPKAPVTAQAAIISRRSITFDLCGTLVHRKSFDVEPGGTVGCYSRIKY
jgi:hypothetical protein